MQEPARVYCPECERGPDDAFDVDRRSFMRAVGGQVAVAVGAAGLVGGAEVARAADKPAAKTTRPAEELVKELFAGLSADQKKALVLPFDHGSSNGKGQPTRLGMYNSPIAGKRIGENYTAAQQELIDRILHAIAADDEGYRRLSRNKTFDGSGSLQGCGALLFGEPVNGKPWAWVFSGHHLTVRCDGRFDDGVGFGGPMYYGHSPNGYSDRNIFHYQTKSVLGVFDAFNEAQRKAAVVDGTPGEQYPSVKFRDPGQAKPGIAITELSKDQRGLVEKVMRDLLSPYRKEDADEVMAILKASGGLDKIHLAFYRQNAMNDNQRWHFWRLEGPGFVWNFRVLPHVHTYVNIARQA